MLRSAATNASIGRKIVRDVSERQYHMLRQGPTNTVIMQGNRWPGAASIMLVKLPPGWVPTKMFSAQFIKKHYGVTPIVALMGAWAIGVTGYCIYAAMTRDAEFRSSAKKQYETVDLRNPKPIKLITINEPYRPLPELADLLDEINKAEKQKKGENKGQACNC